jgi:hypothetical protein
MKMEFCEEITAYFSLILHGHHRKRLVNEPLPSNNPGYSHTDRGL